MIEELWVEFMRRPFMGHPLWAWYADTLDAREKTAFREAFIGLEPFLQAMFLYEATKQFTSSQPAKQRYELEHAAEQALSALDQLLGDSDRDDDSEDDPAVSACRALAKALRK